MKTLKVILALSVPWMLGGCVAVPVGPDYYSGPSSYYYYEPAPVYYGPPAYYGPSVRFGIYGRSGDYRGGHRHRHRHH